MADDTSYQRLREQGEHIAPQDRDERTEKERRGPLELPLDRKQIQGAPAAQNDEMRRIGRDLETARNDYADLYETTPVAFVSLSDQDLIQRANAAARRLLGESEDSPVGQAFAHFVEKQDRGRYFRAIRKVAATGQAYSFELALRDRSGRSIQTHIQAAPRFDVAGRFRYWHLVLLDISPLRRRETELKHVHSQLRMAARAAQLGTWIYDLDKGTTKWDAGLYRLLRLKPRAGPEDEKYFFEFIHPDDRTGLLESIRTYLTKKGDDVRDEFRVVRADGEIRWLAARGLIFRDAHGRPRHIAGINFDITHRKQSEESVYPGPSPDGPAAFRNRADQ